jgi:hypothetical protein
MSKTKSTPPKRASNDRGASTPEPKPKLDEDEPWPAAENRRPPEDDSYDWASPSLTRDGMHLSSDDDDRYVPERIALARVRGPLNDDHAVAAGLEALDAIDRLVALSTSSVALEARAVISAMLGVLLDDDAWSPKTARDLHAVLLGGQPGKPGKPAAPAHIRAVAELFRGDTDDEPLSVDEFIREELATIDRKLASEAGMRAFASSLAQYRTRGRTQAALIDGVTDLLRDSGALGIDSQSARTERGRQRLRERTKKALQRGETEESSGDR